MQASSISFLFEFIFLYACLLHQFSLVDGSIACGGFIKSIVNINYSRVSIKLFTASGNFKYSSEGAPNNGYYFIPVYDNGDYVLKVDAPNGWKFEPNQVELKIDGVNDPCTQGQDINFAFKGFTISGKVLSDSLDSGPQGVSISLKYKVNGHVLKSVLTKPGGDYVFEEVLPGNYEIIADSSELSFIGLNTIDLIVIEDNVILSPKDSNQAITISGYSVGGHVTSDEDRIGGVNFALFSLGGKKRIPDKCNTASIASRKINGVDSGIYLCHTLSNADGRFEFKNLSPGNYRLIAFYRGKNIEFGVEPSHIDFKIDHENVELKENFRVEGFSVNGKILSKKDGKGIKDAQILVKNDKGLAKLINSLDDGVFHLENMKTGTYTLQVTALNMLFESQTVRISPSSPLIPDIIASKFKICGDLKFKSKPTNVKVAILKKSGSGFISHQSINVELSGHFCSFLESGSYRLEPIIPKSSSDELVFNPKYLDLIVDQNPKLDLIFDQFAASVSGSLVLKEQKPVIRDITIDLLSTNGDVVASVRPDEQTKQFKFVAISPGRYRLRLSKADNMWCWKQDDIEITISDKDLSDLRFVQVGYYLTLVLSHPVKMTITHSSSKSKMTVDIENIQKPLRHCLLESGRYEIETESCHLFKSDKGLISPFIFDTQSRDSSSTIIIRAFKHELTGSMTIITPINSSDEFTLSLTREINSNDQQRSTSPIDYTIVSTHPDNQGNLIKIFKITLFAETNEIIILEPNSKTLLFKPSKFQITMDRDCLLDVVNFKGRVGLFIRGMTSPPLAGAKINLYRRKTDQLLFETITDSEGKYIAGPFDCCDDGVTLSKEMMAKAEKDGYLLKEASKFGDFITQKLSSLIVKVTNFDGSPLSEALISISGGFNNFRKNLITPTNGELSFIGLNPDEYFMRAVLKEYKFEPSSRIVDIRQGETATINVKGQRVAYSCYGTLMSMSEEPEPNILVEAVGVNGVSKQGIDCKQLQEEVLSEANGNFRIRDLKPGCDYRISIKKASDNLISRSLPEDVLISIKDADVTDIKLILFPRSNTMEVTGDIITDPDFWPSLRVKIFSESIGDQLLASIPITSAFFSIPTQLPVDNRWYILKLESTLPTYSYSYDVPTITFRANTTFSHFQFRFDPRKFASDSFNTEQDNINTGSLFTLPIFIILGLAFYKYDKVKPICDNVIERVRTHFQNSDQKSAPNFGDGSLRRRTKPRKT